MVCTYIIIYNHGAVQLISNHTAFQLTWWTSITGPVILVCWADRIVIDTMTRTVCNMLSRERTLNSVNSIGHSGWRCMFVSGCIDGRAVLYNGKDWSIKKTNSNNPTSQSRQSWCDSSLELISLQYCSNWFLAVFHYEQMSRECIVLSWYFVTSRNVAP